MDVDVDVDTFPIESFESVEGADDKSEKMGGVNGNLVSVSSRNTGDMGENDASFFDISSGDESGLLILFLSRLVTY